MNNFKLPLLLFISTSVFANHPILNDSIVPDDEIHVFADTMPVFGTCTGSFSEQVNCSHKAMLEHVYMNVRYPAEARINKIEGIVVVSFVIRKDGSITDIKTIRNPGGGLGEDVVRVVQGMPKWKPGIKNGEAVSVKFNLPVRYRLETPELIEKLEKQKKKKRRKKKKAAKSEDN